jgi:hypothetical protein
LVFRILLGHHRERLGNSIGSVDEYFIHTIRIGTTTTGAHITFTQKLGFNITAYSGVLGSALFNAAKPIKLSIKPMKINVEKSIPHERKGRVLVNPLASQG